MQVAQQVSGGQGAQVSRLHSGDGVSGSSGMHPDSMDPPQRVNFPEADS